MGQLVLSVKIREHDLNSSIKYQPEVRYTWLEYPLLCWNLLSGHQFKTSCTFAVHVYKYVIFKGKGLGDRCTARAWGWVHVAHIERLHTWMCSFRLLVALGLFIFACLRKVCNCMTCLFPHFPTHFPHTNYVCWKNTTSIWGLLPFPTTWMHIQTKQCKELPTGKPHRELHTF